MNKENNNLLTTNSKDKEHFLSIFPFITENLQNIIYLYPHIKENLSEIHIILLENITCFFEKLNQSNFEKSLCLKHIQTFSDIFSFLNISLKDLKSRTNRTIYLYPLLASVSDPVRRNIWDFVVDSCGWDHDVIIQKDKDNDNILDYLTYIYHYDIYSYILEMFDKRDLPVSTLNQLLLDSKLTDEFTPGHEKEIQQIKEELFSLKEKKQMQEVCLLKHKTIKTTKKI